jgi:hypothetical protein
MCTINLGAQVQDRFKVKDKNSNSQQDSTSGSSKTEEAKRPQGQQPGVRTQEEKFWDKLVIGGNASLSFGTYTFIYLAPSVGYRFSDNLVAGPGFIYQYSRIGAYDYNGVRVAEYTNTVYGPKAFLSYMVAERFFGGFQFEYLNHETPQTVAPGQYELAEVWTPVLFLEVGLMSSIGRKGFAQIGLRYNVLHGPESPYGSALFPVIGFFF